MSLDRIVDILSTLVAFDTTSRNSNLALIGWVEDALRPLGFTCERIPDASGAKANLWATIGPADRPGFVLSGHTDVVPVDGQDWSSDPFRLREDGRPALRARRLRHEGLSGRLPRPRGPHGGRAAPAPDPSRLLL